MMKFYVTIENTNRLKKSFLNLKLFSVIHTPDILEEYGYTDNTIDEYGSFIVTRHIDSLIKSFAKSKRIRGIIYSNPNINIDLIDHIYDSLYDLETINEVVLLDDYNVPKLTHLYNQFDEIIFFPSVKRVRLIEAQKISDLKNHKYRKC